MKFERNYGGENTHDHCFEWGYSVGEVIIHCIDPDECPVVYERMMQEKDTGIMCE